ncbi:hypothetical protein MVEG_11069 [Podila verticillata NRRL 6337]|uniref:FAD-binding PCMH-type domain-containing protein n=1 Tax=Podila verticillata NRRL 6337 TaxID=1069443 RepID=A0A086TM55_9FUNG|nr:hypothetical protein MVEG_11069 [Podila verticillata NRRL 6337]
MYIQYRTLAATTICFALSLLALRKGILAYVSLTEAPPTSLIGCLQSIKGNKKSYLSIPSSPTYNNDRLGYNRNFVHKPSAIFHPASEADAVAAVVCAAAHNVSIAPRSGGHSYEGYSGGGKTASLVIDLNLFLQFAIDHDTGIATVGAGNRLGTLCTKLWKAGEYLIPAGSCPGVGIGGHALGGGLGIAGRKYGMLSDNIVGLTMVAANGNILEVNARSRPDLFWALRGAGGGSFGLVTEFRIQAYKAPARVTTMEVKYPWSVHQNVINAFGIWSKSVVDDFTGMLYIGQGKVRVLGTFLGSQEEAQTALKSLFTLTGLPQQTTFNESTWYQAAARWAEMEGANLEDPYTEHALAFRFRSLLYRQPISDSELAIISKHINNPPNNPDGQVTISVSLEIWGGKIDYPSSASAFDNHRGILYSIRYGVEWNVSSPDSDSICTECMEWNDHFAKELQAAYSSGQVLEAYQNYIERDIPNGLQAYYGDNLSRLIEIKKSVDPGNIFVFPQAIPLS